jgi:hypothetical protein
VFSGNNSLVVPNITAPERYNRAAVIIVKANITSALKWITF